jgi:hypothetical protein
MDVQGQAHKGDSREVRFLEISEEDPERDHTLHDTGAKIEKHV